MNPRWVRLACSPWCVPWGNSANPPGADPDGATQSLAQAGYGQGKPLLFSVTLDLLPTSGWAPPAKLCCPSLSVTAFPAALAAQLTRAEMLDALGRPYIDFARAEGLSAQRVLWRHAARTALTSVLALSSVLRRVAR